MIIISAGHHAKAKGACCDGISEYPLSMQWADALSEQLDSMIIPNGVIPAGTLGTKVSTINNICVDTKVKLAIEIHFNSVAGGGAHGSETLYCPGSKGGKAAAEFIQKAMGKVMGPDRGVKEGWYQMKVGGTPDYFLKATACPAIIIEPEFIQNHLIMAEKKDDCIQAIARGIAAYLDSIKSPFSR